MEIFGNKKIKYYLFYSLTVSFFVILFLSVKTCFHKNENRSLSREGIIQQYNDYENEIEKLCTLFKIKTSPHTKAIVTVFANHDPNKVGLTIYPLNGPVSNSNPILGNKSMEISSVELGNVLHKLNWSTKDVLDLKSLLQDVGCKWIRTTEMTGNPIEVFVTEKSFGTFSYLIFPKSLSDSLIEVYGKPIQSKSLKNRVIVKYSAAL